MDNTDAGMCPAGSNPPQLVSFEGTTGQLLVSTALVRGLATVLRQHLKRAEGASLESLDDICRETEERMFPMSELRTLLADTARRTKEPALGLLWGMHASPASFGLMTPLISYAPTLRQALSLVAQFSALLAEGACFQLHEHTGIARLRCDLPPGMNAGEPILVELMLAGLVRMFEEFGCTLKDIRSVCFEYGRPAHYHAYALAFGATARFSQPFTGIELATQALDRRHLHHHSQLQQLMVVEAERSLERRSQPRSYAERVLALLSNAPPRDLPEMSVIARRLALSERSLRRKLEHEGTSYRDLIQSQLYRTACSMLRNPDLTLQDVADALGFADSTAFHRAFRRWADLTPAEYRQRLAPTHSRDFTAELRPA